MDSSGNIPPSTSEHSRRERDPGRTVHEGRAPRGYDKQDGIVGRSYGRFLELPVAIVLAVMWVAGVALLGSCALTLFLFGSWLLQV